jgi:hypothetical protein
MEFFFFFFFLLVGTRATGCKTQQLSGLLWLANWLYGMGEVISCPPSLSDSVGGMPVGMDSKGGVLR